MKSLISKSSVTQIKVFLLFSVCKMSIDGLIYLPGSLQYNIQTEYKMNTYRYGLLYSACSWAAALDCGQGYLLDRYLGVRSATVLYCLTTTVGCTIFCYGSFNGTFWLLLSGRIVYGFGVNPLFVILNKYIIHWFSQGKCINLMFSLSESLYWLSISIWYYVAHDIFTVLRNYYDPFKSLSTLLCGVAVFLCCTLILSSNTLSYMHGPTKFKQRKPSCSKSDLSEKQQFTWIDYFKFSWLFWIFSLTCFFYFLSVLSFLSMSQVFLKQKYHCSTSLASNLSGTITFFAVFLSPLFGYLLDRLGHNLTAFTLAFVINLLSHCLFTFTRVTPVIPVLLMAVSLVFSSGTWSLYQYLAGEHQQSLAYGIANTGANFSIAVGTLSSGYIIDKYGYSGFMTVLLIFLVSLTPLFVIIWILNSKQGNILNLKPAEKMKLLGRTEK